MVLARGVVVLWLVYTMHNTFSVDFEIWYIFSDLFSEKLFGNFSVFLQLSEILLTLNYHKNNTKSYENVMKQSITVDLKFWTRILFKANLITTFEVLWCDQVFATFDSCTLRLLFHCLPENIYHSTQSIHLLIFSKQFLFQCIDPQLFLCQFK